MALSSPQSSGPGHPLPQEPDPDDLGDRPHRTYECGRSAQGERGSLQGVVEQASESIVLFDVDSKRVLEANVASQNLLGYTPERSDTAADALRSRSVLPGAFHKFPYLSG